MAYVWFAYVTMTAKSHFTAITIQSVHRLAVEQLIGIRSE